MSDDHSENERWYDDEIAPALLKIGKELEGRGLSMVAVVEYSPGYRGRTQILAKEAGLEMILLGILAAAGNNIDAFVIGVIRHCRAEGIDISHSLALTRLTGVPK